MYSVYQPMPQGTGAGQLDRLSHNTADRLPSRSEADNSMRRPHHTLTDRIRLSNRAQSLAPTGQVDLPLPGDPGGNSELVSSMRKIEQFLEETPRIADSSFGKSVQTLMRGAAHLMITGANDKAGGFPPEAAEKLISSVRDVNAFMEDHPRVANAPFGRAVAQLAGTIVSTLHGNGSSGTPAPQDRISETINQVQQYLETQPRIAEMPLGQLIETLIDGVQKRGDGSVIDTEIQTLAKRIGHFVGSYPRLADSEFGQLAASLTRGILAFGLPLPPSVEPPVVSDIHSDVAVPATKDVMPALDGMEMQKAA